MTVNKEKIKAGVWSAIGGAIVVMIIGFGWGGWVLGSTSQRTADTMTADALVARLAPMCVAQFNGDAEKDRKFEELKAKKKSSNYSEQRDAIRNAKENGLPLPKFKSIKQIDDDISELYRKIKKFKEKLQKKHGKAKALSILAHKIGRAVYYMLKRKEVFNIEKFLEKK